MKFSSKIEQCELSPMRKFHPYALAAEAKGRKIYHLNIGQPDIETPKAFFNAVRAFQQPVLAYAPSPGIPDFVEAVRGYYDRLGIHLDEENILATTGGSEALEIVMQMGSMYSGMSRSVAPARRWWPFTPTGQRGIPLSRWRTEWPRMTGTAGRT